MFHVDEREEDLLVRIVLIVYAYEGIDLTAICRRRKAQHAGIARAAGHQCLAIGMRAKQVGHLSAMGTRHAVTRSHFGHIGRVLCGEIEIVDALHLTGGQGRWFGSGWRCAGFAAGEQKNKQATGALHPARGKNHFWRMKMLIGQPEKFQRSRILFSRKRL